MTKTLTPLALIGGLALGGLAAAPACAGVLISQDFSSGLSANETLGGAFAVGGGRMGHVNGGYADNERSFYQLTVDLSGLTDALFSFDYSNVIEYGWDGWNVLAAVHGAAFDPHAPLMATPSIYNRFVSALDTIGVSGTQAGHAVFDLTPYVGQTIDLRLQFASDYSRHYDGVTFDNLVVSGTAAPMSGVPEPAVWSMMIAGFFGLGLALRRAHRRDVGIGVA